MARTIPFREIPSPPTFWRRAWCWAFHARRRELFGFFGWTRHEGRRIRLFQAVCHRCLWVLVLVLAMTPAFAAQKTLPPGDYRFTCPPVTAETCKPFMPDCTCPTCPTCADCPAPVSVQPGSGATVPAVLGGSGVIDPEPDAYRLPAGSGTQGYPAAAEGSKRLTTRQRVWISIGAGLVAGVLIREMAIDDDDYDLHTPKPEPPPWDGK